MEYLPLVSCYTCKLYRGTNAPVTGPYAGGAAGGANYFKIMQFFTRNWVYTPNFGLKIRIFLRFTPPFVKTLKFATPFSKVCIRASVINRKVKLAWICFEISIRASVINRKVKLAWICFEMISIRPPIITYDKLIIRAVAGQRSSP